jgi:bacitracin synthase 3
MVKKYYMSSNQKRIYIINQLQEDCSYNIPKVFIIEEKVDIDKLGRAFKRLCQRHELLRTTFSNKGDNFYQEVNDEFEGNIEVVNDKTRNNSEAISEFIRPFNLSKAPLMRIRVAETNENILLMFDFHHIISDAISGNIYVSELIKFYNGQELEDNRIQYKDYSAWQNSKDMSEADAFWVNEFQGISSNMDLKTDYIRPNSKSYNGKTIYEFKNKKIREEVLQFCSTNGFSEFTSLLASFMAFLSRYCNQNCITVGVPMASRSHIDTHNMTGMFVNTVAIKEYINTDISFLDYVEGLQNKLYLVFEYQDYPFEKLIEKLNIPRDSSRNPLFDIMFVYQNGDDNKKFVLENRELKEIKDIGYTQAKFDLTLTIDASEDGYDFSWEYCTDLFKEETILYMHKIFKIFLGNLLKCASQSIESCSMLDNSEYEKIIEPVINIKRGHFCKSLLDTFKINVKNSPSKIALIAGDNSISFGELDILSDKIAYTLIRKGMTKNSVVGLLFTRSLDTIVTILAILKGGGAFLPIEPSLPFERTNFILKDSNSKMLVTNINNSNFQEFNCPVCLYEDLVEESKFQSSEKLIIDRDENQLVYIIYTSGSTGKPKGVAIGESSLMNYLDWGCGKYIHNENDSFGFYSPLSFDLTMTSIFLPLLAGLTMRIYYSSDYVSSLVDLINENKVTILKLTPSHMKIMNQLNLEHTIIHTLIVGGEELTVKTAKETIEKIKYPISIINEYGPTEATIGCCWHEYDILSDTMYVPIGRPINNTELYVLDKNLNHQPYGVIGELYIAGKGLAVAYWNNTQLTEEKFVTNPFVPGEKMYMTGDLVYKLPDNTFIYCGRKDTQTKLRGFRIELEEVEKILMQVSNSSNVSLLIRSIGDSDYLCAYMVGNKESEELLREAMRKYIPDYMIPTFFYNVDLIPLTYNGKVDTKRLPLPSVLSTHKYVEPRNERERIVVDIFSEVLGTKVGIEDNFFDLGGDSIKGIRIVAKLREKNMIISFREIMLKKTVINIIQDIETLKSSKIDQSEVVGEIHLSPIQKQFFDSSLALPGHFNQSVLLESNENIEPSTISSVLKEIVIHHDMLRAYFSKDNQIIKSSVEENLFELYEKDLSNAPDNEHEEIIRVQTEKISASMDIEKGPLLKVILFRDNSITYIFIAVHHLIIDSVSWEILIEDLNSCYKKMKKNERINLPLKTNSYKDWVTEQEILAQTDLLKEEIPYWENIEKNIIIDKKENRNIQESFLNYNEINFEKSLTEKLVYKSVKSYGLEVKDILIAALFRSIATETKNKNVVINVESHGRENAYSKLSIERTIGWFTSIYPVFVENIGESLHNDLINVKETLRKVPNKGIGYGILKKYNKLNDKSYNSPDFNFNYLGEGAANISNDYFKISKIKQGSAISDKNKFGAPISLDGKIESGILSILISYDSNYFHRDFINKFAETYKNEVYRIVDFCVSSDKVYKTPSDYGQTTMSMKDFNKIIRQLESSCSVAERMYQLTPLQEGILFHSLNTKGNDGYVIQAIFDIKQNINLERFYGALNNLVEKHEVLRTRIFYSELECPYQVIMQKNKIEYFFEDISNVSDKLDLQNNILKEDLMHGFDFENENLIRFKMMKISEDKFTFIMTYHHVIIDGWSTGILVNDLTSFYNIEPEPNEFVNKEDGFYEQYVNLYKKDSHSEDYKYWAKLLENFDGANSINSNDITLNKEKEVRKLKFNISKKLFDKMKNAALKYHLTINTLVEFAWGILLQSYSGTNDAVFGKVISGRENLKKNLDNAIGLYMNTIPVRVQYNADDTAVSVLSKIQEQSISSMEHCLCSLADIQRQTEYGSNLIKTLLVFENFYISDNKQDPGIKFMEMLTSVREETNYDLTLSAEISDTLVLDMLFNRENYSEFDITTIFERMENILEQVCTSPLMKVSEFELSTAKERDLIIQEFNDTVFLYDDHKSVIHLIEDNAVNNPNDIAVIYNDIKITYKQLSEQSNIIANFLIQKNISQKSVVALKMENSPQMIIGILGVLKAGAAYVPIDPSYPKYRIDTILLDSAATLILTSLSFNDLNKENLYCVEDILKEYKDSCLKPLLIYHPEDLAYILYTSGTTGVPKGVMVRNRNMLSYVHSFQKEFHIDKTTSMLQQATYTFDTFVEEVFPTLAFGGSLIIYPKKQGIDFNELCDYINKWNVNVLSCSPLVLNEINKLDNVKSVKTFISGGDELKVNYFNNLIKDADVYNTYGPTETTVCAMYFKIDRNSIENIPIGKPIANVQVYITSNNKLCGINSLGEICIAGNGVSAGYLNNESLTNQKFGINPFGEGKLYHSGDLGKWNMDGTISFMGRIDNQIKIRGYRVELSEIEEVIRKNLNVNDVIVRLKEKNNEKIICVYVLSNCITKKEVYEVMKINLPIYMVSSYIEIVDSLPMKSNGKIDDEKLCIPELILHEDNNCNLTPLERKVLELFSKVLNGVQVNIDDDFFELGGHSLTVSKLINEIEGELDVRIKVTDVFEKRRAKEICKLIEEYRENGICSNVKEFLEADVEEIF